MPLWGNKNQPVTANLSTTHESTEGAPIGTYVYVKGDQINRKGGANAHAGSTIPGSRARTDVAMFESGGINEFIHDMAVGVYGVFANSEDLKGNKAYHDHINLIHARNKAGGNPDGELLQYRITNPGSGYAGGVYGTPVPIRLSFANGEYDQTSISGHVHFGVMTDPPDPQNGKIDRLNINQDLFVYDAPNAAVDPPEECPININNTQIFPQGFLISFADGIYTKGDKVYYFVPQGNTPVQPLTGNTYYYIANATSQFVSLTETKGGDPIIITDPRINSDDPDAEVHTIQGEGASVEAFIVAANVIGASHAGWVLRKEFTGGREGRVQSETLVAMSSLEQGVIPPPSPAPIVYSIDPDFGTEFGGEVVTIIGENFVSFETPKKGQTVGDTFTTRVLFGDIFSSNVIVANNTFLTAVTPPYPKPDTVDVRVETGYGISRIGPDTKYTYTITEPYVRRVTPNKGGYKGQTNVVIYGSNFESATQVQFDNVNALSFEVINNDYIHAISPPHANGTVNIFVTGANGTSDPDPRSEYTYYSAIPLVGNLNPTFGPMDPVSVTINGNNFIQYGAKYHGDPTVLQVFFGQQQANITSVVSDSQIIVDPPIVLSPGPVDVTVRNTYGNSIPDANSRFTYYAAAPTVSNCSPKLVSAVVPTDVTIYGNNLWLATEISYGGTFFVNNNIRVAPDGKSLVFTTKTDENTNRYMTIEVTTPSGTSPEYYDCGFSYINFPYVIDMSIHAADYRATNTVVITGLNFSNPTFKVESIFLGQESVQFPRKWWANSDLFQIANNTSMSFQLPSFYSLGAPIFLTYNTILTSNTNKASSNTPGCKMYIDNWTPIVDRIDPNIGPIKGFTEIYCYGKNFAQSVISNAQLGEGASGLKAKSVRVVNDSVAIVVAPTVDANTVGINYNVILNSATCGSTPVTSNTVFTYTNNSGTLASLTLNYPGTGYNNNHPPIKISARLFTNGMIDSRAGTANAGTYGGGGASTNNAGQIIRVTANNDFPILFRGYANTPAFEVDPPEIYEFPANTTGFAGYPASLRKWSLGGATNVFLNGDKVLYTCQGPGGPLKPLQNQTYYYITQLEQGWPQSYFQLALTEADAKANVAIFINDYRLNNQGSTTDISLIQGMTANVKYTLVP